MAQEAPQTVILASDEASLYLQVTLMRVWSPIGQTPVVAVDPGRKKTHFYGTLNLRTGDEYVMQAEKLNAATTALHLEQLLAALPKVPILLLWDKARHHMGESVRQLLAQNPRLQLLFFPTASPDLNPQEHVWKAARSAVSHNHADEDLSTLATRFHSYLETHSFSSSFLDSYGFNSICPAFI
jgi:transposase